MRDYLILHMIALAGGIWLDLCLGDPHTLPHPIRAIGALISILESRLYPDNAELPGNKQGMIFRGFLLWLAVMAATVTVTSAIVIASAFAGKVMFMAVEAVSTYYCLAARSLRDESMKVYRCLQDEPQRGKSYAGEVDTGRLTKARDALSMIVGRDTDRLDESGIVRATVETVAENTSDGVIAPLLYAALGGPILGMCYKAINTMDSMIGYRNDRYEYFGRFAARADDVANFIPSRLSALFMIISAGLISLYTGIISRFGTSMDEREPVYSPKRALAVYRRDRNKHKSPNSAQTESVCAGALGIRLGGRSYYGTVPVDKPYIGDDVRKIEAEDIRRAIKLMFVTEGVAVMILIVVFLEVCRA